MGDSLQLYGVYLFVGDMTATLDFYRRLGLAIDEVSEMVHTVRGGVEFATDNAVSPVIRVVAVARGVRRGLEAVTSFARRGR